MKTGANAILSRILEKCPADIVVAEAAKIGMEIRRLEIMGTGEQWGMLQNRLFEKPKAPEVEYCAACDMDHQYASDCPEHPDHDPSPDTQEEATRFPLGY